MICRFFKKKKEQPRVIEVSVSGVGAVGLLSKLYLESWKNQGIDLGMS